MRHYCIRFETGEGRAVLDDHGEAICPLEIAADDLYEARMKGFDELMDRIHNFAQRIAEGSVCIIIETIPDQNKVAIEIIFSPLD